MILTSTTGAEPFTPPWELTEAGDPRPGAPVFHLRSASVIERGQMEAELSGQHRAGRVRGYELRQAMQAGVATLLADDPELDAVIAAIAAAGEAEAAGTEMPEREAALLKQVAGVLVEHWPDYRELVAQAERRREIAPIVALRRFCTGWDSVTDDKGEPVPYERGLDGLVAEKALGKLSHLELLFVGNRAYAIQYAWGQAGNSPQAAVSESVLTTSPSDAASKAAGRSPVKGGRKTRASRSPRGSSRSSTSTS